MSLESERSTKQSDAALAVAKDEQTDEAIARGLGITKRTLERWKKLPAFIAAVEGHRAAWAAEVKARGIADVQNRVDAANDRHQRMQRVIEARSTDPLMAGVAGGDTGLLVASPMLVKVYDAGYPADEDADGDITGPLKPLKESRIVFTYAVDTGLLKEMREHEKQVAQDLGQWTEKKQLTGKDGAPLVPAVHDFDFDRFHALAESVGRVAADARRIAQADGMGEPLDTAAPD